MQIANPIYDVVFKFLMEDSKVAKLFLGVLTGFEILDLEFLPQETSGDYFGDEKPKKRKKKRKNPIQLTTELTIYRIDFSARIKTEEGEKLIIIELQKSKLISDIPRFRQYLGKQYMNRAFFTWVLSQQARRYKAGIPIYPIFILGESIEEYKEIPVLVVENCIRDRHTQEILDEKGNFIPSLFHKGLIINVPALSAKRRDELEKVLSIFDQNQRHESYHIMNVNELDFPAKYRPIIKRLQAASLNKEMRDKMQIEDDYISEINEIEQDRANALLLVQELKVEKELALKQAEKDQQEKEKALNKLSVAIKTLFKQGTSLTMLAQMFQLSEEEIGQILKEDAI